MGIPLLGGVIDLVSKIAGKAIVDKDKVREIQYKLEELRDKADERFHEELMGQIEVNKVEAAHPSIFVAGGRPFIIWVCGVSIGWTFVLNPMILQFARFFGYTAPSVTLDTASLMTLVLGMLGIGAQRSFDKLKGTDTKKTN